MWNGGGQIGQRDRAGNRLVAADAQCGKCRKRDSRGQLRSRQLGARRILGLGRLEAATAGVGSRCTAADASGRRLFTLTLTAGAQGVAGGIRKRMLSRGAAGAFALVGDARRAAARQRQKQRHRGGQDGCDTEPADNGSGAKRHAVIVAKRLRKFKRRTHGIACGCVLIRRARQKGSRDFDRSQPRVMEQFTFGAPGAAAKRMPQTRCLWGVEHSVPGLASDSRPCRAASSTLQTPRHTAHTSNERARPR